MLRKPRRAGQTNGGIPDLLTTYVARYLSHHRPVLDCSDGPHNALWLSSNDGKPMSYLGVEDIVTKTTS